MSERTILVGRFAVKLCRQAAWAPRLDGAASREPWEGGRSWGGVCVRVVGERALFVGQEGRLVPSDRLLHPVRSWRAGRRPSGPPMVSGHDPASADASG